MAKLLILHPDGRRFEVILGAVTTLGRHPECSIRLEDSMVSKRHASITRQGGSWVLRDLDSRNGTLIGGRPIRELALRDRDEIAMGMTRLLFLAEETPAPRGMLDKVTIASAVDHQGLIRTRLQAGDEARFLRASEVANAELLREDYDKLLVAYELGRAIGADVDLDRLLERILDKAFEFLPAQRGLVLLHHGNQLVPQAVRVRGKQEGEIVISRTIVDTAIKERQALLFYDAASDPRLESAPSVHIQGIRSAMCVPLIHQDRLYGLLHFDTQQAAGVFTEKDLQVLSAIAAQAAGFLENAYLARELTQSEARFRELIEGIPDMIAVLRQGRFVYVNPALVGSLGYQREEDLLGQPFSRIIDTGPVTETVDEVSQLTTAELTAAPGVGDARGEAREERLLRRDGTSLIAELSQHQIRYDGELATLLVARDVTERRQMQARLLEADRMVSIGTLAAGVAHEINNPLAYVIANLQYVATDLPALFRALESGDDSANVAARRRELETALRDSWEGAERVRRIVRDLKTFSRADEERRGPVDVREVLDTSVSMAFTEIRHRARLHKEYGDVPLVEANEGRLGQVFLNLLVNAAQAIREGDARRQEIRVRTRTGPDGEAIVEVSDTGQGIAPDVLSRIFDPFFTTKPPGVGTGLGLAICHGIVRGMGGEITVESEVGKGSTFRVTMPPRGEELAPAEPSEDPDSTATLPGDQARILIIDDEPALADALRRALHGRHLVSVASSGREALDLLKRGGRFDVLFCDLLMADVTGMDLYEALSKTSPGMERRLVFMTAGAFTARAREFLARIPNPRIDKPFRLEEILGLLRDRSWSEAPPDEKGTSVTT